MERDREVSVSDESIDPSFESGPVEATFESGPIDPSFESGPIGAYKAVEGSAVKAGSTCMASRVEKDGQTLFKKYLREEFRDNPLLRNAFLKEYTIGLSLNCIYFPHYYEMGEEDGLLYILMENIEGQTLNDLLESTPDYFGKENNLQKFLQQFTEALHYLHSHQIVHHDLQPSNIMLTAVNHDVRIIDLGYCYSDNYQSSLGETRGFSAPEKQCDARSDIYSVGRLLQYISEHSQHPLPQHVLDVAERCTKEDPNDRYFDIPTLQKALLRKRGFKQFIPYILLIGCLAALAGWGYWRYNRTYDFTSQELGKQQTYYKIINEDSLWVEVVNPARATGLNKMKDYLGGNDNVGIPDSVKYDGKYYTVVRVGDSCFANCNGLQVVTLPKTLRSIGAAAFMYCVKMSICQLPASIREIEPCGLYACGSMGEYALPDNLEKMGAGTLVNYSGKRVVIPHRIKILEQDLFAMSYHLEDVTLPDSLEYIKRGVFYYCTSLQHLTIPRHVKEIGMLTFYECPKLKDLYLEPLTPPSAYKIIENPKKVTVHVPAQALAAYQKDPYWSQFRIVTME